MTAPMSAEEARGRIEALEARVAQLADALTSATQRVVASEAEHARVHAELQRTQQMAGALRNDFRLIDPKSMVPDKFGQSSGPAWLDWSEGTRSYVEMLDTRLADALKSVENREAPVTKQEYEGAEINDQHAAQFRRYLKLRTEGNAKVIVKAAQSDRVHVLEQWRRLSWEYDPIGLGTELIELQELTSPERLRAKTEAGISAAIEQWEEMERRHRDRQGVQLPDKVRISVLFKLIPAKLAEEILKQTTKWASYTQLKEHLHSVQFLRTKGPAPMSCSNLEGGLSQILPEVPQSIEEDTITTEDGELLRLEKRHGKRVAVKVSSTQQRGARPRGRETECFRCGRKGHIRPNCNWSTHVDGGAPRPPAPPKPNAKGTNSLEEQLELANVSVDICALEPINVSSDDENEDEWTTWNQDPWISGTDPWSTNPSCSPCGRPATHHVPDGKVLLANLFKVRAKCSLCERAGVYENVAKQLEEDAKTHMEIVPAPTPPVGHVVSASSHILDPNFLVPPAPSTIWDPEPRSCMAPKYVPLQGIVPPVPMPLKPPTQFPNTIWLASCESPEVLEWDASEITVGPHDEHVHQSERVELACEVCLGTGMLLQDMCPLCDGCCSETSVIELNAVELCTVHHSEDEVMEITLDSGAGEPVAAPEHFPTCPVVDSPGSLSGQKYLGPGGEEIPNLGQISTLMSIEGQREGKFTFQAAPVRKPLLAVSSVNDKGNLVVFDGVESFIIPGKGPQVAQLRKLIQAIAGKIKLHRKNGVYHMRAWKPKPVFSRQGK